MNPTGVIPPDAKQHFWDVVEACLREFHDLTPARARKLVSALRDRVESPADGS